MKEKAPYIRPTHSALLAILQLRIYALYRERPLVLFTMLVSCIISWSISIWIIIMELRTLTGMKCVYFLFRVADTYSKALEMKLVFITPILGGHLCLTLPVHLFYTFIIPSIVFEGALCSLALHKLLTVRRAQCLHACQDRYARIIDPLLFDTFIYFIG